MNVSQVIVTLAGAGAVAGVVWFFWLKRAAFRREQTTSCSDTVVFDAFGRSASLPEGELVAVELMANEPGEYSLGCPMGMYRGTLVVE